MLRNVVPLISALHLLHRARAPDREKIRAELSGNVCRCTGYQGIVDAVEAVVARGKGEECR